MFVLRRQNSLLETEMSIEGCWSNFDDICIWAASSYSSCSPCVEKRWRPKKVEKKLKDKQKLEDEDATFSSARIIEYF